MSTDDDLLRLALTARHKAGYEAGYARAIADILAAGVFVAEGVLRDSAAPADARAVLYRFVATLEAEARCLAAGNGEMSDGLGI